jgi:hypothetical protein
MAFPVTEKWREGNNTVQRDTSNNKEQQDKDNLLIN